MVFPFGFTHGSKCRAALMALLTGLYTDQWDNKNADLRRKGIMRPEHILDWRQIEFYRTLPRELAKVGYASFQGGKHWEGSYDEAGYTVGTKTSRGVDPYDWRGHGGDDAQFGRESIQPAFDFIDSLDDQPFFMWFAPKLPHTPHDAGDEFTQLYADKDLAAPAAAYYANVSRLDARVGQLMSYLERTKRLEDTLIVFISDNGWEQPLSEDEQTSASLGGPKGKASAYELGFRSPVIVSFPGNIQSGRNDSLIMGIDLFATILDYAGATPPPDRLGLSLRPLLQGEEWTPRSHLIEKSPVVRLRDDASSGFADAPVDQTTYFVRTPSWRYLWNQTTDQEELYRIDTDPYEENNVVVNNPSVSKELRSYLSKWMESIHLPNEGNDLDGVARNTATGEPISGIELVLGGLSVTGQELEFRTVSGAGGYFQFHDIPAGDFTVTPGVDEYRFSEFREPRFRVRVSLPQGALGGFVTVGVTRTHALDKSLEH
jgi:uncharacterized sulfatase